jgi:hypothetical protein
VLFLDELTDFRRDALEVLGDRSRADVSSSTRFLCSLTYVVSRAKGRSNGDQVAFKFLGT